MRLRGRSLSFPAALALLVGGCTTGPLGTSTVAAPGGTFGNVMVPIVSLEDRRFASVIRQGYDFSCGSAALATLLHYHYDRNQTEEATFRGMWAKGDRAQIRKLGFSLFDMKRYLASIGLEADGYEVSLEEVRKSGVPGIALLDLKGYRHFVVVKAVSADEVLVGDPALGLKTMSVADFAAAWNGVYFALNSDVERGRRNFGGSVQWTHYTRGPLGSPFLDPLSNQALTLTAPQYREF